MTNYAVLYRVFVEDVDTIDGFQEYLAASSVTDATVYQAHGLWEGGRESTYVVEIVGTNRQEERDGILDLARKLRDFYNQECVAVQIIPVDWALV